MDFTLLLCYNKNTLPVRCEWLKNKVLNLIARMKKDQFLFEELVKRDFKKKYKRTVLGMFWSMLSPLMQLFVMALVFTRFFGREMPHYIIYLFSGNLIFSYFNEATNQGMEALEHNAHIFSKINVPKYLFVFSKNVSSLINFALSLCIYFVFVIADGIGLHWNFLMLVFPVACLLVFNLGMGMILSALHVFFKDIKYLYGIFTQLLMYLSAVFYTLDMFEPAIQKLFYLNPVYSYISYFRTIVLDGAIPPLWHHGICFGYAFLAALTGFWIYHKNNYKFLYYI